MAIDKEKTKKLIDDMEKLFDKLLFLLPKASRNHIKKNVMEPIYDLLDETILSSRPPVIFIVGRSGHGKSALLNALANKQVAKVGDIKPTTIGSEVYQIVFEEECSEWTVVDTRGIFETTTPEGGLEVDVIELLKTDILEYKPDIIIHVAAATELRNMSNDLEVFREVSSLIENEVKIDLAMVLAINKVDMLGNPRDWPLEGNPKKMSLIKEASDYALLDILESASYRLIDEEDPIRGYELYDNKYKSLVPICSLEGDEWNIRSLSDMVGKNLPSEALLDYYQAQGRNEQLREISTRTINSFATIAGGIGLSPVPFSDSLILTPLQIIMIMLVGALSGRELNKETLLEYLAAAGLNVGAAMGFRALAQQIAKLLPGAGNVVSSGIATSGTYAVGKSAEAYFFSEELKSIEEYMEDWNRKNK